MCNQDKLSRMEDSFVERALSTNIRTFGLIKIENSLSCFEEKQKKKQATHILLLKYFLTKPNELVPREELFELFCSNSLDPANLLHVWMSKLDATLKPLNLNGRNGLILSTKGTYQLNPAYIDCLDSTRVDKIAARLDTLEHISQEGLDLCREALTLYQALYLENTEEFPWLKQRRDHYYETFRFIANVTLDYIKALNDPSLLPFLLNHAKAFIPKDDNFYRQIATFQLTLQNQINLTYFRSQKSAFVPEANDIYVRFFGSLELENRYGHVVDPQSPAHPSGPWFLLAYLLKNRGQSIDQFTLMEKFWPQDLASENNDGAFRVRLSRIRKALEPLQLSGRSGLIQFSSGFCSLNPNYTIHSDEDTFAQLMAKIDRTPVTDINGLNLCVGALELYRDRFLANTTRYPWIQELQDSYNQEFCRLAFTTLERMKAHGNTQNLPLLCQRALALLPDNALLHVEIISFLLENHQFMEAARHISALSQHKGDGFEWLDLTPLPSDTSAYVKTETDIRVRLFGEVELENQSGLAVNCRDTYRWALLKYLLLHPDQIFSAQDLDSVIEPDRASNNVEMSQKELRRRMREDLFPLNLAGQGLIRIEDDHYFLNPMYHLITDLDILNSLLPRLSSIAVDDPDGVELCFSALSLFRGPFIDHTWEAPWLAEPRKHYAQVYLELANSALERVQALGIKQGLSLLWRSAITFAPHNKELHKKISAYMLEHAPITEIIPYTSNLARYADFDITECFSAL